MFSALVHDLDHLGVPNTVLVNEGSHIARKYKGKSVAEQNSVDLAFKILLQPEFQDLQDSIFASDDEYSRFRSLVVNLVLATDIMDIELGSQRKQRWAKAFNNAKSEASFNDEDIDTRVSKDTNRKATIVVSIAFVGTGVLSTWAMPLNPNNRPVFFISLSISSKPQMLPIQCSTGMCSGSGMSVFSERCMPCI